jgi:hypothetical protein
MTKQSVSLIFMISIIITSGCRVRSSDAQVKDSWDDTEDSKFNFGFELKDESGTIDILGKPQPYTAAVITSVGTNTIAQISGLLVDDWLKALEWTSSTGQKHFYRIQSIKDFQTAIDLISTDEVKIISIYGGAKGAKGEDKKGSYNVPAYPQTPRVSEGGRCITRSLPMPAACYCSHNGSQITSCKQVMTAELCKVGRDLPSEKEPFAPVNDTSFEAGLKCSPTSSDWD